MVAGGAEADPTITLLFRPHCNCGCNCGGAFLDQPFILAAWNDGKAGRLGSRPARAKAGGVELPRAASLVTGFAKRFAGHFAVWREDHFELGAAWCGGGEGLSVEEGCLDIARRHGCSSDGATSREEDTHEGAYWCSHERFP